MRIVSICFIVLTLSTTALADVTLPAIISDNMVLQRNTEITCWGHADPHESITILPTWQQSRLSTQADAAGQWSVKLSTTADVGPHALTIQANNHLTIQNILFGEVWLCSGQSNMEWSVAQTDNAQAEIAAADYPQIRLFTVKKTIADQPQLDCSGAWSACSPQTIPAFSAVAYFFGRELHQKLNCPMGLINSSWGGTTVEAWTSKKALEQNELYDYVVANCNKFKFQKFQSPTVLYNGMIAPLIPFSLRGAIWYQGESNCGYADTYSELLATLIHNWRSDWAIGDFPFYFVQIAPFNYFSETEAAILRQEQFETLSVPNTGMAVTLDIADIYDIHPTNKQDVGKRLSLWALAKTYGQKDLIYSGPLYKSMTIEGNRIRLFFDHVGSGLISKTGPLRFFTIAGKDRKLHPANADIDPANNTVVVYSHDVPNPVAVRYGWLSYATGNLFNKENLPASTFKTDNWP